MRGETFFSLIYDLNRSHRLNFQYYLWTAQTGYQLSLSIPIDKGNIQIADVGTGTGYPYSRALYILAMLSGSYLFSIWFVDLSRMVPAPPRSMVSMSKLVCCPVPNGYH